MNRFRSISIILITLLLISLIWPGYPGRSQADAVLAESGGSGETALFDQPSGPITLDLSNFHQMYPDQVKTGSIQVQSTGWQTLLSENFETTNSLWGVAGNPTWAILSYTAHTGAYSAYCAGGGGLGVNPAYGGAYPNNMNAALISGPYNLSDAVAADISYWRWVKTQPNDNLIVCLSIDGAHLYGWGTSGQNPTWTNKVYDLTSWPSLGNICGQTSVYLALIFQSDGSNTDTGVFIDDLVLRKYVGAPLAAATDSASDVTSTSATLNGRLTGMGTSSSVQVSFEYGLTTSYGSSTSFQTLTTEGPFSAVVNVLTTYATYHYRAKAVGATTVYGQDMTFTPTKDLAAATDSASGITATSATLNGRLTGMGSASSVQVSFEYGLTTGYGSSTSFQTLTGEVPFSASVTNLTSYATYHYRAKAVGATTVYGQDMTFIPTKCFNLNFYIADAAISPDGQYLYATSKADKKLYMVNLTDGSVEQISFSRMPESIAVSPNGDAIYVAELTQEHNYTWFNPQNGFIAQINPATRSLVREFEINEDPGDIEVSSDGFLYVCSGSGQWDDVKGYDLKTTAMVGSAYLSCDFARIKLRPDDKTVYLIWSSKAMSPTRLLKYAVSEGNITYSYFWPMSYHGVHSTGYDLALSPDGSRIYCQSGDVFSSADAQETDMLYLGALGSAWNFISFDEKGNPFTIDPNSYSGQNTLVRKWDFNTYAPMWSWIVNGSGRFVFHSHDSLIAITDNGDSTAFSRVYILPDETPEQPTVRTNPASVTSTTSVILSGNLTDTGSGSSVSVSFEWGINTGYTGGQVSGVPSTLSSPGVFTGSLTGLTPGQTYHYRSKAIGDGTAYGNDMTFFSSMPEKLVFLTSAQTFSIGTASGTITVQTQDAFGTPAAVLQNTKIDLASSSSSGRFDTIVSGPFDGTITSVNILAGSNQTNFYYRDTAAGNPTLTASGMGLASAIQQETLNPAPTLISLISSLNPSTYGQSITISATVASSLSGLGMPTGMVTFKDGATTLGAGNLDSSGKATFTVSNLTLGSHSITAVYAGDSNFTGKTSTPLTQTVNSSAARLAFVTQPGGAKAGLALNPQPVVAIQDAQGNLVNYDNTTLVTLSVTGNTSALLSGNMTVQAVNGYAAFSGISINKAGTYTLAANSNPTLTGCTSNPFTITPTNVNLVLLPALQYLAAGGNFTVTVQAQCGNQAVSGINAYLDFDPEYLSVQSAAAGTSLSEILTPPVWDNSLGTFGFCAAQQAGALPDGDFAVVSITFQARQATPATTEVTFHTAGNRTTAVEFSTYNITGTLTGGSYGLYIDAPLCLSPANIGPVSQNQTFDMDIRTDIPGSQQVNQVQAYLKFDPGKLAVLQITPGSNLSHILYYSFNNESGLISFSAEQLTSPFPTGNFTVATIRFSTREISSAVSTQVTISLNGPATTSKVYFAGTAVPGTHGDAVIRINPLSNITFSVVLQGSSRPDTGWVVPLSLKLFPSSSTTPVDVLTVVPAFSFNLTTSKSGPTAIVRAAAVDYGTYDITATTPSCLINVKRQVSIAAPETPVSLGKLLEGNANGDNKVNIQDFGLLAGTYGKKQGQAGFDVRADFDLSGAINITDFGLLASNYGKSNPITVP